jgi:hypothetical protein
MKAFSQSMYADDRLDGLVGDLLQLEYRRADEGE